MIILCVKFSIFYNFLEFFHFPLEDFYSFASMLKVWRLKMFNNPLMYGYNPNLQHFSSFNVFPVGKIEEVKTIFHDLQGKPLFFFDQSRNEFFVKQRNVETGEVHILRYKLSSEPIKTPTEKDTNYYDEQFKQLRSDIESLKSVLCVKAGKSAHEGTKDFCEPEIKGAKKNDKSE